MNTKNIITLALILAGLTACNTAPNSAEGKAALNAECDDAIADFKRVRGLERFFSDSAGYAVFPAVGKGGLIIGGAYGDGQLYEGGEVAGYCDLSQGTVGLQAGGQKYRELIFFRDTSDLEDFKRGNFEFSAQVSAVAVEAGASTTADYQAGVVVFTMSKAGLMLEASIGGQRFNYVSK